MMQAHRYVVVSSLECFWVCCCVFIRMYLFFLYKWCLIIRDMIYRKNSIRIKLHDCMVKRRPFIYIKMWKNFWNIAKWNNFLTGPVHISKIVSTQMHKGISFTYNHVHRLFYHILMFHVILIWFWDNLMYIFYMGQYSFNICLCKLVT